MDSTVSKIKRADVVWSYRIKFIIMMISG